MVACDFNGDGKLDLAISFSGNPPSVPSGVSVLLGNGDGTFQAPTVVIPTDGSLAVADVNGDGKSDLVLQNLVSTRVSWAEIYLGNGNGTFSNTHSYFLNVNFISSDVPVIADFNLDGKLDVAAGNYMLLGNGDGTFQGIGGLPIPFAKCQCAIGSAVVGDFNKNAAQYIAAADTNTTLYILSNDGTGTLAIAHTYTLGASGLAAADLNGDGNLDLLVVDAAGYSVLLGNGDGSFQSPAFHSLANGAGPYSTVIADFNRDDKLDFAIPVGSQTFAVLLGNGDGIFGTPIYTFTGNVSGLVSADFNGDGKPDLAAVGASGIAILLGNGDGTFQAATFISTVTTESVLFTADLNGDGKPDLITGGGEVFLGNGDGTFPMTVSRGIPVSALADVNGDGTPDVIGPQNSTQCCGFYLGNGEGNFGLYIPTFNIQSDKIFQFRPGFTLAADLNGAGKQMNRSRRPHSYSITYGRAEPSQSGSEALSRHLLCSVLCSATQELREDLFVIVGEVH